MKLTYRGIQYSEDKQHSSALISATTNKEIIYRGNSPKARINPNFPWLRYINQLLHRSESKPIVDPITFWYDHKREFLKDCWRLSDLAKLDRAWNLTIQIERAKALKSKQKTKLKYRGVTYYK